MIETVLDVALIAGLAAAGVGAWRLNTRITAFRAIVPELRTEIEQLNRGILKAEQVLATLRTEAKGLDAMGEGRSSPKTADNGSRRIRGLMSAMRTEGPGPCA